MLLENNEILILCSLFGILNGFRRNQKNRVGSRVTEFENLSNSFNQISHWRFLHKFIEPPHLSYRFSLTEEVKCGLDRETTIPQVLGTFA